MENNALKWINTTKCMGSYSVQLYTVGSEQKIHVVEVFLSFGEFNFFSRIVVTSKYEHWTHIIS